MPRPRARHRAAVRPPKVSQFGRTRVGASTAAREAAAGRKYQREIG